MFKKLIYKIMSIIKYNNIESYIINIRNKNVILDKDVLLYMV